MTSTQPNIVLILVDDLGFSDLPPYGGEINTPHIEALAEQGVVFTNYHTAASCAPTRGMLLTGVDSHRNGVPNIVEALPPEQRKHANYQGALNHNVVTVATLLQNAGYHTYITGKWHLGMAPDQLPFRRGFERTVAMADTGADNWEQKPYLPIYDKANWFEDGEELTLPEDFYSSRYLVDRAIEFIDSNRADGRPFFSYIPFLAVHIPVQAPREYTQRYLDHYNAGWSELRRARTERAIALGVIPPDTVPVDMSTTADWAALDAETQRYHAKRMAVYAGMIEAMDHHIGRLVHYLQAQDLYDNTVFILTSDNGSEGSGGDTEPSALRSTVLGMQDYENSYETLGERGSYNNIGPSFASAAAAPLAFYKFFAGEGGMRVPLIVAGPGVDNGEPISPAFTFVTDLAPTVLDLAGVPPAGTRFGGRPVEPMIGSSLAPLLRGETRQVHDASHVTGYELGGNAALFQGDYKIVLNREAPGDNEWHLYNIVTDPAESRDLKVELPERFAAMRAHYDAYARSNGVVPVTTDYRQIQQVATNGLRDRAGPQILWLVVWLLALIPFYALYRSVRR